ncbi:MAG: winged helix-turn-helix transcriptional regulator [Leadbetterella sp.]|nr:winged helix-turn-helix transcriptional regulator [Leadbetterella sp.]
MDKYFKALNDGTRREILEILRVNPAAAGEIADRFNISKPSISHHLDILKQADLVTAKKKGQFVMYSINLPALDEVLQWFSLFKTEINAEKPRIRIPLRV